jgi:Bacterial regulatory proteins, luxR family
MSSPEIAAKLLLSRRTVATPVSHMLNKLNVHSRIDIVRKSAHSGNAAPRALPLIRISAQHEATHWHLQQMAPAPASQPRKNAGQDWQDNPIITSTVTVP